jgi:hypothetical protein
VEKSAWGKVVGVCHPPRLVAVDRWPVLVHEGLHLALAEPYGGGEFADARRFVVAVVVEQPPQQVTGMQSVSVAHGSPFVSTFLDTRSIALSTALVQFSGQGDVHADGKEFAKHGRPGGYIRPGTWTMVSTVQGCLTTSKPATLPLR